MVNKSKKLFILRGRKICPKYKYRCAQLHKKCCCFAAGTILTAILFAVSIFNLVADFLFQEIKDAINYHSNHTEYYNA